MAGFCAALRELRIQRHGSLVSVLGGFGNALLVFSLPFLIAWATVARSR